jgi:arginase
VIDAPSSAGAYGPGQELAPAAFRRYGLLRILGRRRMIRDCTSRPPVRWRDDPDNPSARNVAQVAEVATTLAGQVNAAFAEGNAVLELGGDCTVELGVVTGAVADGSNVGLIYIDGDADLNTPATGDGVLDWMGMAHLLDVEGAHPGLAGLGTRRPLLSPDSVTLCGVDNITDAESSVSITSWATLPRSSLVPGPGLGGSDRLLVHVDFDVLAQAEFAIAENTRRTRGLTLALLGRLLAELCALTNWRGLTLTEINPERSPDQQRAFEQLIDMLDSALPHR